MPRASSPLAIGELLQVRVHNQWWPSRLEDLSPEGALVIAWPMDEARQLLPVEGGCPVEVLRIVPGDGTYSIKGVVDECRSGGVPLVHMTPEGTWQRSQRRGAFRAGVAIRPRLAQAVFGSSAHRTLRLGITNVSGTGVQVRSQDELRRGDLLALAFQLGDDEIELQARVRRVVRLERVWDAGCVFEGVSERLSERIIQFIFTQQRVMLRARRGDA